MASKKKKQPSYSQKLREGFNKSKRYYEKKLGIKIDITIPDNPKQDASPQEKRKTTLAIKKATEELRKQFSGLSRKSSKSSKKTPNIEQIAREEQRIEREKEKEKELEQALKDTLDYYKPDTESKSASDYWNLPDVEFEIGSNLYSNFLNELKGSPLEESLKKGFESEISKYGEEAVMRSIAQNPDLIEKLQKDLYYKNASKSDVHQDAKALFDAIIGTIATFEQEKELSDAIEQIGEDFGEEY